MKIVESEILHSAPNDPKPNSRNQASKVPHICPLQYPKSQIFVSFTLRSAIFEIFHILGFLLTPMLKFQSATKFLIFWQIAKISIIYIPLSHVFIMYLS